jgi:hypothetical protein
LHGETAKTLPIAGVPSKFFLSHASRFTFIVIPEEVLRNEGLRTIREEQDGAMGGQVLT